MTSNPFIVKVTRSALVLCMGPSIKELEDKIESFKNLFAFWVTKTERADFLKTNILDKIDEGFSLLFSEKCNTILVGTTPNILITLLKMGFDKIFVFGFDGGPIGSYYRDNDEWPGLNLLDDTTKTNKHFMEWAEGLNAKEKIFNCSPESLITCFNKISVDEAIIRLQKLGYEDLRGR